MFQNKLKLLQILKYILKPINLYMEPVCLKLTHINNRMEIKHRLQQKFPAIKLDLSAAESLCFGQVVTKIG